MSNTPSPSPSAAGRLRSALRRSGRALAPVLVAACALAGTSLPAAALAPDRFEPVVAAPATQSSTNWSGYAASGGTYTAVSGTWVIPQITPDGSSGASAAWVGIGGFGTRDLIQAGTEEFESGGRVTYRAWIETLPAASQPVPLAVSAGDTVTVSIASQGEDIWLISLQNVTTGKSLQRTVQYASSFSSAEWIQEAPSAGRRTVSLDNFGSVQFTSGSAVKDGQTVTIAGSGAQPISMIGAGGQRLAAPSVLGSDGASFSVSYSGQVSDGLPPGAIQPRVGQGGGQGSGRGRGFPLTPHRRGRLPLLIIIR